MAKKAEGGGVKKTAPKTAKARAKALDPTDAAHPRRSEDFDSTGAFGRDADDIQASAESPEQAESLTADRMREHPGGQGKSLVPVKSPNVLKRVVYMDVRKNVQPGDFPEIHEKIRKHYDGLLNLKTSLSVLREELAGCRKGIRAEEAEINRLNAMIASGVMELKDERVIETWDYGVGSIASEAADEGVRAAALPIPMREMLSMEKQRSLSFKTPQEDCRNCKYMRCRAESRVCRNFADCIECPDFACSFTMACGFGKDADASAENQEQAESPAADRMREHPGVQGEALGLDCFFCPNVRCDADMADVCGQRTDCAECASASCSNKISGAECSLGKTCGMPF